MSTEPATVSDMLATVKSREVQRGTFAEAAGDTAAAARHFLAAAHMELVLAEDYAAAGLPQLALRSRISAASCLWRGGQVAQAQSLLDDVVRAYPAEAAEVQRVRADLAPQQTLQTP
jgi:hypothetical protein